MRITTFVPALAVICFATTSVSAQEPSPPPQASRGARGVDVGTGLSQYGPHVSAGLEHAMSRWLALRGEGMFARQKRDLPGSFRVFGLSLSTVASFRSDSRVSPYIVGGYSFSAGQGTGVGGGPLGGAGLRFRFGALKPYVGVRAQHGFGVPMSLGFRF